MKHSYVQFLYIFYKLRILVQSIITNRYKRKNYPFMDTLWDESGGETWNIVTILTHTTSSFKTNKKFFYLTKYIYNISL